MLIYCLFNVGERFCFVNLNIIDWIKFVGFKILNDVGFVNWNIKYKNNLYVKFYLFFIYIILLFIFFFLLIGLDCWCLGIFFINECVLVIGLFFDIFYRFRVCCLNKLGNSLYSVFFVFIIIKLKGGCIDYKSLFVWIL